MKNRSFHPRKIRIQETPKLDFGQLKSRTINALDKLGRQRFSTEPGGYALENWTRGVNVLLDDFEEKAGAARLSEEYLARRRELDYRLSNPAPVASTDEEMSELAAGISSIESKIESERALMISRISELKAGEAKLSAELKLEQGRAADAGPGQDSGSFFKRLFSGKKALAKGNGSKVEELESELASTSDELREQQKRLRMIDLRSPESHFAEEWNRLEPMQSRLKELEKERLDRAQFIEERAEMMGSMAGAISKLT